MASGSEVVFVEPSCSVRVESGGKYVIDFGCFSCASESSDLALVSVTVEHSLADFLPRSFVLRFPSHY